MCFRNELSSLAEVSVYNLDGWIHTFTFPPSVYTFYFLPILYLIFFSSSSEILASLSTVASHNLSPFLWSYLVTSLVLKRADCKSTRIWSVLSPAAGSSDSSVWSNDGVATAEETQREKSLIQMHIFRRLRKIPKRNVCIISFYITT